MKKYSKWILGHAKQMVGRNFRSYALLSVTILLSFTFLLGYLAYTDSDLYNTYKDVLRQDRNAVLFFGDGTGDPRMEIVLDKTEKAGKTGNYKMLYTLLSTQKFQRADNDKLFTFNIHGCFLPSQVWGLYDGVYYATGKFNQLEVAWLDGEDHEVVHLENNQIIMERRLYEMLGLDKMETPIYEVCIQDPELYQAGEETRDIPSAFLSMEVVGLVEMNNTVLSADGEVTSFEPWIFLPLSSLEQVNKELREQLIFSWSELYYTEAPEVAYKTAETMGIKGYSIYSLHEQATTAIRSAQRNKAIIAVAMIILLGINLYSCFTNALNDRKFEIGVKRAIGAGNNSIVRQFLYESVMVMGANTALSVVLVLDGLIGYKYIMEQIPSKVEQYGTWTIYISPYSLGMFALCVTGLTVAFSLIFAYRATQVQIVNYLKAE